VFFQISQSEGIIGMLTTIEMLKKIEGHPDCQDCVTGGQYFTRSYWLACDDELVWGADPDGHEIEMTRTDFEWLYQGYHWVTEQKLGEVI
jgi:hypothetical protein